MLEDILKLIVMATAKVTGVDICSLWLIEEGEKDKKARLKATQAIDNTQLMVGTKIIEEELEKRKLIDRAKEILMTKKNFSAERAFCWIQKKSMDTRKSMKEIAKAVIISQDI